MKIVPILLFSFTALLLLFPFTVFLRACSGEEKEVVTSASPEMPLGNSLHGESGNSQENEGGENPIDNVLNSLRQEGGHEDFFEALDKVEESQREAIMDGSFAGRDDEAMEIFTFAVQAFGSEEDVVKASWGKGYTEIYVFGESSKEQFETLVAQLTAEKERRDWSSLGVVFIRERVYSTTEVTRLGRTVKGKRRERDKEEILFHALIE